MNHGQFQGNGKMKTGDNIAPYTVVDLFPATSPGLLATDDYKYTSYDQLVVFRTNIGATFSGWTRFFSIKINILIRGMT